MRIPEINAIVSLFGVYILFREAISRLKKREGGGGGIKNDRIEFIRLNPRFRGVNQI